MFEITQNIYGFHPAVWTRACEGGNKSTFKCPNHAEVVDDLLVRLLGAFGGMRRVAVGLLNERKYIFSLSITFF